MSQYFILILCLFSGVKGIYLGQMERARRLLEDLKLPEPLRMVTLGDVSDFEKRGNGAEAERSSHSR